MQLKRVLELATVERQGSPLPLADTDRLIQVNFKLPVSVKHQFEEVANAVHELGGPHVSLSFALRQGLRTFTQELGKQLKAAKAGRLHKKRT